MEIRIEACRRAVEADRIAHQFGSHPLLSGNSQVACDHYSSKPLRQNRRVITLEIGVGPDGQPQITRLPEDESAAPHKF